VLERVLGAGAIVWFYLGKALLPVALRFVYPQWDVQPADWRWWIPAIGALGISAALVTARRRPFGRALLATWMFFVAALVPVLGFADTGAMKFALVADHYQYIALLGVVTLVAAAASIMTSRVALPAAVGRTFAAGVLILLAAGTWQQTFEYADAETLYRAMLRQDPGSWLAHNQLGSMMLDGVIPGGNAAAIAEFKESVRAKPDAVEAHFNLCEAFRRQHRLDDAAQECLKTIQLAPDAAKAYQRTGEIWLALGRVPDGTSAFEKVVQLRPADALGHVNLADTLLAGGQVDRAVEQYREALRLSPNLGIAHGNLGQALEMQGHAMEAAQEYTLALQLDPTLEGARAHLSALQSGQATGGESLSPRLRQGQALIDAHRPADATAEFLAVLKIQPHSADAHDGLGQALADLGDQTAAEREFREAVSLRPSQAEFHRDLADLLQAQRNYDAAVVEYREGLRIAPGMPELHNNLGVVLMKSGRPTDAAAEFREALRLKPDYSDARDNLQRAQLK